MSAACYAVRLLGQGDEGVLAHVAADVFDGPVDMNLTCELLADRRHHLAVATAGGVVVGFASGVHYLHPDKRTQMFVDEVGIASSHRRRGIGRAVVGALLSHARAIGCTEAWVLTDDDNLPAQALYGGLGGVRQKAGLMFSFSLDPGTTTLDETSSA